MKPHRSNALGRSLVRFFQEYLPTLRGMSQHTIHGYRDAVVLFLRYLAEDSGRPVDRLDLSDINAVTVSRFLTFIEEKRGNSINTRNARLAAIHTFSRFLANDYPEHMVEWQRVLALPFKRGATQAPIEYLEADEVKAVLRESIVPPRLDGATTRCSPCCSTPAPGCRRFLICVVVMCVLNRLTMYA